MPIKTPSGILEVEDAKLRASYLLANTSVGIGTSTTVPDGASIYINEDNPTIRFQEGTSVSAARILAKSGTLRLESGTDYDQPELTGDIAFSNIQGGTTHMIIKGSSGNVGVGTVSPAYTLDVSGNVHVSNNTVNDLGSKLYVGDGVVREFNRHDRPLTKYPEVELTADAENVAGYKGYAVQYSGRYDSSFSAWTLFGEEFTGSNDEGTTGAWIDSNNTTYAKESADAHNGIVGSVLTSVQSTGTLRLASNTPIGSWISLELPNSIKLAHVDMRPRLQHASETSLSNISLQSYPRDFGIWGYNGSTWVLLKTVTDHKHTGTAFVYDRIIVDSGVLYNKYAIVITRTNAVGGSNTDDRNFTAIGQLYFHGTEEGDESVDVVHRSVPNKPGTQHLEVYWDANDTTSYSGSGSTTVNDISGSDNEVTGTITGTNGFDSEYNAWVFDGSGDYISGTQSLGTGQPVHSQSVWFKINGTTGDYQYISIIGTSSANSQAGLVIDIDGTTLTGSFYGGDRTITQITQSQWYHAVFVYPGGTTDNAKYYINGVELPTTGTSGTPSLTGTNVYIGANTVGTQVFNGSIANFRLFSKALNADQVHELYEYDAERFGHRTNVVSLHKGNLGIGVNYPNSRFEVASREDLQEYPPQAMTGYETYMEGHGVFRVSAGETNYASSHNFHAWEAFNDSTDIYHANNASYNGTDYAYSGNVKLHGQSTVGNYVLLELPYKIKVQSVSLGPGGNRMPEDFKIVGSNDGFTWTTIKSFTGETYSSETNFSLNSTEYFNRLALIVTKVQGDSTWQYETHRYFGTPAPSSLEDGHLTLGKALTTPRVSGHPAGAETPRAESLLVHYDTTVDSVNSGTTDVVDTSGNDNHGAYQNGAEFLYPERAFKFDGTDNVIYAPINNPSGAWVHSVSFWVNISGSTSSYCLFSIDNDTSGTQDQTPHCVVDMSTGQLRYDFWSNSVYAPNAIESSEKWYHVCLTYSGGGASTTSVIIYVNGIKLNTATSGTGNALNVAANGKLRIGTYPDGTAPHYGFISKFKIWNVALTADEVAAEYALGHTGKAINITDTAVCIGGTVPRAHLDVRGSAIFDGNVGIGKTNSAWRIHIDGYTSSRTDNYLHHMKMSYGDGGWGMLTNNTDGWNQNLYWYSHTNESGNPFKRILGFENDTAQQGTTGIFSFTGQHRCFMRGITSEIAKTYVGLIVSANEDQFMNVNGPAIETGSNAISISESIPLVSISQKCKDKSCFGVVSSVEDLETRQDRVGRVISYFNKELGDTRVFINSLGEGAIWVTNINGPLESGDYITTSNVAGYGMKQESEFLTNYTVAKITMNCDFNPQTQYVKQIIKEMSNVNYYRNISNIVLTENEYNQLSEEQKEGYTLEVKEELVNVLDEHGQLQWEDTEDTEKAYKIRYITADGAETDEANAVHIAAFVGCTYHCG